MNYHKQTYLLKSMSKMALGFFLLLFTANLMAQDDNFTATINRNEVALNGSFKVTYTITNANVKAFTPPNFDPFESYGPSTANSMNFINGKTSRSQSYTFTLKPTKLGKFKIPAAAAIIDGKNKKTNTVEINVVQATNNNSAGNNASSNNRQGNSTDNKDLEAKIKEVLHARVSASKLNVYEGEQLSLSYKMLYRVSLQDIAIIKSPSFDGFLSHEIELTQDKMTKTVEEFRGQRYNSSLFKQYAIFPTKAGQYTIDPMELESVVAIERQTRSWFSQYEQMKVDVLSNKLNINVKSLPAGKPSSFTGAVGKFKFSVDYDKTATNVDEPITLKLKVSGTGNIKLIKVPDIELPGSFEVYDPKIKESITKKSYTVGGSKSYEYLIIPRGGGEFQFPDLEFSYFDLETEKYVVKKFDGPLVKVEGEAIADNGYTNNPASKEEIELLSSDIKYIKTSEKLKSANNSQNLITKPIFHLLTWFPLLSLFFFPIIYRRRKSQTSDLVAVKSKKAHKEANKRLAMAKKLMSQGDDKAYYNEIVKSIWGYLGDKFNIPAADFSKGNIATILHQHQVDAQTIKDTSILIGDCEMAIYAPGAIRETKTTIFEKAGRLIEQLDKEIIRQ